RIISDFLSQEIGWRYGVIVLTQEPGKRRHLTESSALPAIAFSTAALFPVARAVLRRNDHTVPPHDFRPRSQDVS
ncbi:MAG: hypothetical protein II754_02055, partial [Lachnospiraceae bacterium]|nr:hypothetical protein [Lachnospiraceae bacterium]